MQHAALAVPEFSVDAIKVRWTVDLH